MTDNAHPVALVTGAARRIGATIARTLHAAGYDLALHCRRSRAELDALIGELESARANSTLALQADLADVARLPGLVHDCVARFGRLDALVNNASTYYATPFGAITPQQWDELFAANARAPLFLAQAAAPHLKASHGSIVNITDIYAERPLAQHAVYGMSKAALRMATFALAQALGPEVRVNAVAPGNVLASEHPVKAENLEDVIEGTALRRRGAPDDIAGAVLWLVRDATYVSGQTIRVDGGRILGA
ncbi:MAG: FolM Alternative dihydrofolate reductase 1 [Rhodanobacteraceae bacterium]|jgi:pteridine reductase|nr:MAG: FolM Alternative dihydrofolate reductase 1 [Rhodanobacteraceae bacterium]